jgi:hypothetical protein
VQGRVLQDEGVVGGGGVAYVRAFESVTLPPLGVLTITSTVPVFVTEGAIAVMSEELWK